MVYFLLHHIRKHIPSGCLFVKLTLITGLRCCYPDPSITMFPVSFSPMILAASDNHGQIQHFTGGCTMVIVYFFFSWSD